MKSQRELVQIYQDTLCTLYLNGYEDQEGNWHEISSCKPGSRFYSTLKTLKFDYPQNYNTVVEVVCKDSFVAAKDLENPLVLNMASYFCPGGGVHSGAKAQEEDLCRRSNLLQSLYSFHESTYEIFGNRKPVTYKYPIPKYGGIYTPGVTVFRADTGYGYLKDPYKCSVVSVSAIKRPRLTDSGDLTEEDKIVMKGKIRSIFRIAILHNHQNLVLGAFGCGAYGNPPKTVALLFKEVMRESEFRGAFKRIIFAVIDNKYTNNYKVFKNYVL